MCSIFLWLVSMLTTPSRSVKANVRQRDEIEQGVVGDWAALRNGYSQRGLECLRKNARCKLAMSGFIWFSIQEAKSGEEDAMLLEVEAYERAKRIEYEQNIVCEKVYSQREWCCTAEVC